MYQTKPMNFGFVILSPDHDVGRLKSTMNSIRNRYLNIPCVCATGKDATTEDLKEMNEICPAFRGGTTFTSLINKGMAKGHKEWNLIIVEGTIVRRGMEWKYSRFIENDLDILYPIVVDYDRDGKPIKLHISFDEAPLNGIFIHQKAFKLVGNFGDNPLEIEKLLWALDANKKGCKFKGILGAKMI